MEIREDYIRALEQQLTVWRSKIGILETIAQMAEPNTRAGYFFRIGELLSSVQQLESRVCRLKNSSERNWKRLQDRIEFVRYDVDDAVTYALERIQ